jgi:hypothetical protein
MVVVNSFSVVYDVLRGCADSASENLSLSDFLDEESPGLPMSGLLEKLWCLTPCAHVSKVSPVVLDRVYTN